jgi:hypothetical protein
VLALAPTFVKKETMTSARSGRDQRSVASASSVLRALVAPAFGLLLLGCAGATDREGPAAEAGLDGRVVGVRNEGAGGRALHLLDRSGSYVLYYAHLDRYAEGVRRGRSVRQGDILGYVGTTGNAHGGSPHLHFEVAAVRDPHRWWDHEPLNAYVFLTSGLDALPGPVAMAPGRSVISTEAPPDHAR